MSIQDFKERIPQVIFENPDELISGGEHQKLLLDGVDLVEAELNKKADSKDVETELDKKVDNTSFDTYKEEQELVNGSKVDKESYKQDLDAVNDRINASDAGVSKNKQELNGIKKLLSEAADSSKIVGTAKGGGVITFPSNVLTNASPRYRINGATDEEFKSVQTPIRIKSVGGNLFDPSQPIKDGGHYIMTSDTWYRDAAYASSHLIRCVPSSDYYINKSYASSFAGVNKYDINGNFLVGESESIRYGKFSTSPECYYVRIALKKDLGVDDVYVGISEASSRYVDSSFYVSGVNTLSSVSEMKDYIENGKLHKNIKRHYFSKEDEWTLREDYEGANYRYYMTLPFDYKATGAGVEGELLCNNFTPASNVENALTARDSNTIALYKENASTIYLTLNKKVTDVNSAIPDGTFIDVISPQTEVTSLDTSGMVVARPNGTIFVEPVANLTALYNNGLDVSKLTIEEVESFSTFKDGNYLELDTSKVSIKNGKLTHPDAVNGLCYLVYRHDNAPIYGNNEVDYYNSEKTLKSPNGKVWKKVESATDEGELVTKLEEVK